MPEKILVIEDEHHLRENILTLLEFEQYEGLGAADGEEGIALARKHLPDLIICDIIMPRLDGYGVLHALRQDPDLRAIPLIFLTSKTDQHDLRHGMSMGANDYITKPFAHEDFIAAVRARLDRQKQMKGDYQQQLEQLHQSIVFALPQELHDPLADIIGKADHLLATPENFAPEQIRTIGATMLETAHQLNRQIENYLLFTQLEILRLDPKRVIVQRETYLNAPRALITETAHQTAAHCQRTDDLQLTLQDVPLHVSEHSLRKIVEELVHYTLNASQPNTPIYITEEVESNDYYLLHITAPGLTLDPTILTALETPRGFSDQIRDLDAPLLGLIVAYHLLQVHGGQLHWSDAQTHALRWTAQFKRYHPAEDTV